MIQIEILELKNAITEIRISLVGTIDPTLVNICLFDNIHPNRCEVILLGDFNLHFPHNYWCWAPVDHFYVIFGKMSTQLICVLILIWLSSLCVLHSNIRSMSYPVSNPDKTSQGNYSAIPLVNMDAKSLTKCQQTEFTMKNWDSSQESKGISI